MLGPVGAVPDLDTVDDVVAYVRAQGGRATLQRRLLLEVLFSATGAVTAEDLGEAVHAKAPDTHMSTVYRILDELQRLGVVVHVHLGHGPALYELASRATARLVCEGCGRTIYVPDEMVVALTETAANAFGFALDPRHFALPGRCAACTRDAAPTRTSAR